MSRAMKELWYMSGEVPMYGIFEAKFNLKNAEEMIKTLKELVGSKPVVKFVSVDGGVVRVELVDGRVVEVSLSRVLSFVVGVVSKIIYVLGSKVWDYLTRKQMVVLEEVGREASVEKIKVSSEVEVEVEEAVSIMDAILAVVKEIWM